MHIQRNKCTLFYRVNVVLMAAAILFALSACSEAELVKIEDKVEALSNKSLNYIDRHMPELGPIFSTDSKALAENVESYTELDYLLDTALDYASVPNTENQDFLVEAGSEIVCMSLPFMIPGSSLLSQENKDDLRAYCVTSLVSSLAGEEDKNTAPLLDL